jgi:N-methylhydantoinase A
MGFTVGIDIGGTFTDTVVMDADGAVATYKSPTTPRALVEGLLANLRSAAELEGLDTRRFLERVERVGHGTTVATNAYIERRGAKVALLTTRGFEDTIFHQRMMGMTAGLSASELTDYSKRAVPEPLVHPRLVFGIRERVDYRGAVIGPMREDDVEAAADRIAQEGVEAVAVCFLWSFRNPEHERRAGEILRARLPGVYLTLSSELVPRLGEYERTATTLVNAYLGPVVSRYTETVERRLADAGGAAPVLLLDSSGSVMTPSEASRAPVRLLLSGPSGGVTASQLVGAAHGHAHVITFDMGGTSTDVGLVVGGRPVQRRETVAEKYHLLLPMVDIRTIGAGGGSLARVEEGGYLRVGPESAGADPGPACYGRGGELPTVTDADLVLGILDAENFLGGRLRVDAAAAEAAVARHVADPLGLPVERAAAGIKRIVDARMSDLLRTVTIEQGHDPREFVLYAFGGAGPTHAPAFALDVVDTVLVPASQSVHSALGAIASDVALTVEVAAPMRLSRDGGGAEVDPEELERLFAGLEERARASLRAQGVDGDRGELHRFVEVRFARQTKALPVPYRGSVQQLLRDFLAAYAQRYGAESVPDTAGFELVTFVVEARGRLPRPQLTRHPAAGDDASSALRGRRAVYDAALDDFADTPVYDGPSLRPGNRIEGPAVVEYDATTVALPSGQEARVDELLGIRITRTR